MKHEVLEFIILPPFSRRAAVACLRDQFEQHLRHRFPGYSFRVGPFAPVGSDDDFCVVPVMNFIGDDGKSYMCEPPKRWMLQEISEACRELMHDVRRFYAA